MCASHHVLPLRCCRLVLEAAGEVLTAAKGAQGAVLPPARSGVFVGISWTEYARLAVDAGSPVTAYTAQGAVLRCAALLR